jgi:2,3-bisphosphoglycerate-independent phosphoglycerate mutase
VDVSSAHLHFKFAHFPPGVSGAFVKQTLDFLEKQQYGQLATVVGRYYAMDRDKRWERIQIAYEALVAGIGEKSDAKHVCDLITQRYQAKETDEFLKPIILSDEGRIRGR